MGISDRRHPTMPPATDDREFLEWLYREQVESAAALLVAWRRLNGDDAGSESASKQVSAHDLRDIGADGRTPDGKLTVVQAARRMGVNPMFLRMGLRAGRFPFGTAIQMPGGRWSYYINARRFEVYMAGEDMAGTVEED